MHRKPIIAGYVTRPNPLSLVERVPLLQHFRFLGPDIIAQDPREIAPEVFGYLGIRYVILHGYMLPPGGEREAVFGLVQEILSDQLPSYQDAQITVYQVGGQEPKSPFLILGSDWGERQEWHREPGRELGLEATCAIISPSAGEARLAFTAFSTAGIRSLGLGLNAEFIGNYEITAQAERFVTGGVSLQEGVNILRLRDRSEGQPAIVFTSLDLYGD